MTGVGGRQKSGENMSTGGNLEVAKITYCNAGEEGEAKGT